LWWDEDVVGHILGDALIFLAQSRNPHLWATVTQRYGSPLVELRTSPSEEWGWIRPDAWTRFYDDWLDNAVQPREYVEDYLRQVDLATYNPMLGVWEEVHESVPWRDWHDIGGETRDTLTEIFDDRGPEMEVWFCLPTPQDHQPYKVRRPSEGIRYETERILAEYRAPDE
jgi:hypothetical protein